MHKLPYTIDMGFQLSFKLGNMFQSQAREKRKPKGELKRLSLSLILLSVISLVTSSCLAQSEGIGAPASVDITTTQQPRIILRSGWSHSATYQHLNNPYNPYFLSGLDIEIADVVAKQIDLAIDYEEMTWEALLKGLEAGTKDIAMGATYTDERAQYAYFTDAYRYEENSLFVLKSNEEKFQFKDIPDMLEMFKKNNFRLEVIKGYLYGNDQLNAYILDPENKTLSFGLSEEKSLERLLNNEIDGFLGDRLVVTSLIWEAKLGDQISELPLGIKVPVHFMLSKKTVPETLVNKFNHALHNYRVANKFNHLIFWYLYPALLMQTADRPWFSFIEALGTISFAISGVLLAYQLRTTLFGALVLAFIPSMGGGILRDVIFRQFPVEALKFPKYLFMVLITVLGCYCLVACLKVIIKKWPALSWIKLNQEQIDVLLKVTDAAGLATFVVSGIIISLVAKLEPLWLWGPFFAFVTGAAGTILRDIMGKRAFFDDLEGGFFSEIAVVWGLFLSLALTYSARDLNTDWVQISIFITLIGVFLTRLAVYFFKIPNIYFRKNGRMNGIMNGFKGA